MGRFLNYLWYQIYCNLAEIRICMRRFAFAKIHICKCGFAKLQLLRMVLCRTIPVTVKRLTRIRNKKMCIGMST